MPIKVLFLYSEIAAYVIACLKALHNEHDVEIHLVRWPINPEAPFKIEIPKGIRDYDKSTLGRKGLLELAEEIKPNIIFCPGWMDKDYLHIARKYKGKVPIVAGMDNKWEGKPKQKVASLIGRYGPLRNFDGMFVPGPPQHTFARKLGFKESQIREGYYSADVEYFNAIFNRHHIGKSKSYPKRFIYAGRYYEFKGVLELWKAFIELYDEGHRNWELWSLGTGDIDPKDHEHPAIKHFGFVQPNDLEPILKESGVFVLASHKEPWAVVVHEFAAAGFPLCLSDQVGSASILLEEGKNGRIFKSGSVASIKKALLSFMTEDDDKLLSMSVNSNNIAQQISPSKWADTFLSFLDLTS
jgi:glycosyltransferase involved in cell wall biosynthesis